MPRQATGSPRWNATKKVWEARLSGVPGHDRVPVAMPGIESCSREKPCSLSTAAGVERCANCERAVATARIVAKRAKEIGAVPVESELSSNEWYVDYLDLRDELGLDTSGMAMWNMWCGPQFGTTPMARVKRDSIVAVRDGLARAARLGRADGGVSPKRAANLWSELVTTPFARAFSDDDPLYSRVRVAPAHLNPTIGVKPPVSRKQLDDDERERQALEPAEGLTLLSCTDVPVEGRRFYAACIYSGLRPAEIYGIERDDIRLSANPPVILVQRSRDMKSGEIEATKNRQSVRKVPIHPELRPLLKVMVDALPEPRSRLFPVDANDVRSVEGKVDELRVHLALAGITRPELVDGTPQLMPFDVRSFRTTFGTWCAKAGYDSAWVSAWLGHKPRGTTARHYVKDTPGFEDVLLKPVAPGVVPPFPPLPADLIAPKPIGPAIGQLVWEPSEKPVETGEREWEGRDLNDSADRRVSSPTQPPGYHPPSRESRHEVASSAGPSNVESEVPKPTQSDDTRPVEPGPPSTPDGAIRTAVKVAVDAGDDELAAQLLGLLRKREVKPENVIDLDARRRGGKR